MSKKKSAPLRKTMIFEPDNVVCTFEGEKTVLEIAIENEVDLNHSCGGMGSCTTCKVFVLEKSDELPAPVDVEAEHARMRGFKKNERLACQIHAVDGLVVERPISNLPRKPTR